MAHPSDDASTISALDPGQQVEVLQELARTTRDRSSEVIAQLDTHLAALESKYGCSSEQMRERLSRGELEETPELGEWLLTLSLRDRVTQFIERLAPKE